MGAITLILLCGEVFSQNQKSTEVTYNPPGLSYSMIKSPSNNSHSTQKPLFALKTNLLFDLFTLANIELEVPIRAHWSIAGESVFPWWVVDNHQADSKRNRLQLVNINIEGKYWWRKPEQQPILTGWFIGLYGGGGCYDFEYHAKGNQGEFFIAAGVSGGYAHTINQAKTLRLEYAVGVGYLGTRYRNYKAEYCCYNQWHAVEQHNGKYHWIGPTKAKVSLSWLINYKSHN